MSWSPERQSAYYKTWLTNHREEVRAYLRKYYIAHREKIKASSRANGKLYRQKHPEIHCAQQHRRRACKSAVLCTATAEHEQAIKAAYKYRCAYCGRRSKQLTIDHVIPLQRGGGHIPENLVPACRPCNSAKRDRPAPFLPPIRLLL